VQGEGLDAAEGDGESKAWEGRSSMNLIEGIQQQQKRLREEIIPMYQEIGISGLPALQIIIRPLLDQSEKAIASGDAIEMICVLELMREVEG
jgi:hypothetical protein